MGMMIDSSRFGASSVTGFYALSDGSDADISDTPGIQSGGTFTIPAGWNNRKVRVMAGLETNLAGNVYIDTLKGGSSFDGAGKNLCANIASTDYGYVASAPIVAATGDAFTINGSIGTGSGSWKFLEVLPSTFKGALVNLSGSAVSIGTTATVVTWNNEVYDTNGYHDNATNNSRLTVPSGSSGLVRISAGIEVDAAGGDLNVEIYKNGAVLTYRVRTEVTGEFATIISPPLSCTTGDYFEIFVLTQAASNLQVGNHSWAAIEELPSSLKYAIGRLTANKSIPSTGVLTLYAADAEDVDVGGWFTAGDNHFTVPSGITLAKVGFCINKTNNSGGLIGVIHKNGSAFAGLPGGGGAGTGIDYAHAMSGNVGCASGDTFDFKAATNAGATNVLSGSIVWIEEAVDTSA